MKKLSIEKTFGPIKIVFRQIRQIFTASKNRDRLRARFPTRYLNRLLSFKYSWEPTTCRQSIEVSSFQFRNPNEPGRILMEIQRTFDLYEPVHLDRTSTGRADRTRSAGVCRLAGRAFWTGLLAV